MGGHYKKRILTLLSISLILMNGCGEKHVTENVKEYVAEFAEEKYISYYERFVGLKTELTAERIID